MVAVAVFLEKRSPQSACVCECWSPVITALNNKFITAKNVGRKKTDHMTPSRICLEKLVGGNGKDLEIQDKNMEKKELEFFMLSIVHSPFLTLKSLTFSFISN